MGDMLEENVNKNMSLERLACKGYVVFISHIRHWVSDEWYWNSVPKYGFILTIDKYKLSEIRLR